jgi:hypothetical protein
MSAKRFPGKFIPTGGTGILIARSDTPNHRCSAHGVYRVPDLVLVQGTGVQDFLLSERAALMQHCEHNIPALARSSFTCHAADPIAS